MSESQINVTMSEGELVQRQQGLGGMPWQPGRMAEPLAIGLDEAEPIDSSQDVRMKEKV